MVAALVRSDYSVALAVELHQRAETNCVDDSPL